MLGYDRAALYIPGMSFALPDDIKDAVSRALTEDVRTGDVTANLIPPGRRAEAHVRSREKAVLCGTAWFDEVFLQLDPDTRVKWEHRDGDEIAPDTMLCTLQGNARSLLTGERTALNFLQALSGTATVAREYSKQVSGTRCKILDTRKTIPGLRTAQKYATRCGGAHNHRMGLFDGILIKENHIAAAGSIAAAVGKARETKLSVEVEAENLAQVAEALDAGADFILLDNFSLADLEHAVVMNYDAGATAKLEASGGLELEEIAAVAATGVDYISVGALTKNLHAVDLSMRFGFSD